MLNPLALYIHWPFCRSKCPYCDFNSHVREGVAQEEWRAALLAEMAHMAARTPGRRITSIFFGGGTPSLMPPATVAALIEGAQRHWGLDAGVEITLEANPTSAEAASFAGFRAAGVNRVSLGVQALNAADLAFLGRHHSAGEALRAVALAADIFPRYSFDLIYARPGQSLHAWEAELTSALAHARGHLSLYQLTIEENTAFHHAYHVRRDFALPADDLSADLYRLTQDCMEAAGLPAYEVSNHAAPGQESRHNLAYWRGGEYAGIGPGAHGRLNVGGERVATQTLKSPERWLEAVQRAGHGVEVWQPLLPREAQEEQLMMHLRLNAGFPRAQMPFLQEARIAKLQADGLLADVPGLIKPTPQGMLLLNYVTAELL